QLFGALACACELVARHGVDLRQLLVGSRRAGGVALLAAHGGERGLLTELVGLERGAEVGEIRLRTRELALGLERGELEVGVGELDDDRVRVDGLARFDGEPFHARGRGRRQPPNALRRKRSGTAYRA